MARQKQNLSSTRNRFRTKENSHFAMIDTFETQFDFDHYEYAHYVVNRSKVYCLVPVGVIFQQLCPNFLSKEFPKYILNCDLTQTPPPNYRPSHLLIVLKQKEIAPNDWDNYTCSRFGLLRLGKVGFECNPERIFLFKDTWFGGYYDDVTCYITQWNKQKAELFLASPRYPKRAYIHIHPSSIYQSSITIDGQNNYSFLYVMAERHLPQVVDETNGDTVFYLKFPENDVHSQRFELCQMTFCSSKYDMPNVKIICELEGFSSDGYYECLEMVGTNKTKVAFLLSHNSSKFKWSGNPLELTSGLYELKENEEVKLKKLNFTNFNTYFTQNMKTLNTCKLVNGKYLVMGRMSNGVESTAKELSSHAINNDNIVQHPTFDRLFAEEIIWIVLDLNMKTVKRVFPREDPIASSSSTNHHEKRSKKQKKTSNQPQFLFIQDGDLNGGFANPFPRNSSKNQLSDTLNYISEDKRFKKYDLQIPKSIMLDSNLTLCSMRPFPSNPDLFQIMVHITYHSSAYYSSEIYGRLFQFYFRMREECSPCFLENPVQFCDLQFMNRQCNHANSL
ncbi:hypothetical protein C9374_013163 [Naegleria lovaniensis]|uniref:Uncharacterized protein n=1 Tax=Naegleria lovaniensis TaxID=51637 RepID=A0AA88KDC3_NAELO|nr:uncharacterized protein C9374_013163 [Naegleria lovaniensis]KAG2372799.1 hypothetical protein C9374_013163 [Naegleria lovaniensis]